MELGDLVIVPDMHIKKNGEYLPVYYFGDDGSPEPSGGFRIVHNNTGIMAIKWAADGGAAINVNWGDGTVEPFTTNITHDYSGSGAAPFTITLEGEQSEISKLRKLELPYQDTTITEVEISNLLGLRDLDIFEVDSLTTFTGIGVGHTETIDVLFAHCNLVAGDLYFSNVFDIGGKYNFSQNPLVTNVLSPSKTISTSITNFKYEGLAGSGFTPNIDIDISNFTNLSNTVHIDAHTSVNSLVLPSVWGGVVNAFNLHELGGISGAVDLRNIDTVVNLYLYSNPNVTSYDLRTITWNSGSDLWMNSCTSLTSFQIDNVEIDDVKVGSCGFTDFVIPFGTNIVFKVNCEMVFLSLTQLAIDTIVENIWDNRTKWTVPGYTPTFNMLNTTVASGTFDGTTDWTGAVPNSPQAKLWDLANNHGFTIQNNT